MATPTPTACDQRGDEGRLYYNTGTAGTPTWVEHVGLVGDVNIGDTEDEDELTIRDPDTEFKAYVGGKSDLTISGQQVVDPNYEGYQYMNQSRGDGDPTDWLYLTGDISETGHVGFRGDMRNKDRSLNNPQTGSQNQNFSLRPAACSTTKVRPVQVVTADSVSDYDPTTLPA